MVKTEPETVAAQKQFQDMHEKGAKRYGGLWLQANQFATDMLMQLGITPNHHRLLGTAIALKMCIWHEIGRHKGEAQIALGGEEHF